jgi:hypothetical protein
VANERCEDFKGDQKNACERDAKAKRDSALAAAKGAPERASTGATSAPAPATRTAPATK